MNYLLEIESIIFTAETAEQIKSTIKLIGKVLLVVLLLAASLISVVSSIFNKVEEVTTVVNETVVVNEVTTTEEITESEVSIEINADAEWYEQFEVNEEEIESYNIFPELGLAFVWNNEENEPEVYTTKYFHEQNKVGVIFDNTFCPVILDPDDGYYVKLPRHKDGEGVCLNPLENILKVMMQQNYEAASI